MYTFNHQIAVVSGVNVSIYVATENGQSLGLQLITDTTQNCRTMLYGDSINWILAQHYLCVDSLSQSFLSNHFLGDGYSDQQ